MRKNTVNVVSYFKPALAALCVALAVAQTPGAGASAGAQAGPAQVAGLRTSAAAKRTLDDLGTRDFKRVKDARMREGLSRAVAALRALAKNSSEAREAALITTFERTIKNLKSLPQPASADTRQCDAHYERCIELCKEAGGNYGTDCKLCGIEQNGCYLTKLAMEMTKDPRDPTP